MIRTKKDLKECIKVDKEVMGFKGKNLLMMMFRGRTYEVELMRFIINLRKMELAENIYMQKKNTWNFIVYYCWRQYFWWYRKRKGLFIDPNVFDVGLKIVHPGYIWVDKSSKIGRGCTILPRVLLGKKKPGLSQPCIFIGDNCYIGTGTTILGPVNIGNNVTIGAGSVVTRDFPDNCIIAGNPATIIKYKKDESQL